MKRKNRMIAIISAILCSAFAQMAAVQPASKPHNRIVILLDRSGSFHPYLDEARNAAWEYRTKVALL